MDNNPWQITFKSSTSSYVVAGSKKHLVTLIQAVSPSSNGVFGDYQLDEEIYDLNSDLREESNVKEWDGAKWNFKNKWLYIYSPTKKILSTNQYSYSYAGHLNQPELSSQNICTYDNMDRLMESVEKYRQWDGVNLGDKMVNWSKIVYTYFEGYHVYTSSYFSMYENTWQPSSRVTEYDPQYPGKASSSIRQIYLNDQWVTSHLQNYFFDTDGTFLGRDDVYFDQYGNNEYEYGKWKFKWGECESANEELSIYTTSAKDSKNSEIIIPIRINNFKQLLSSQFSLSWNPSVATFEKVEQFGLPGISNSSFGTTGSDSGKITFSWSSSNLKPQTVADSTALFYIRFKLTGNYGDTTFLKISNTPVPVEFINAEYSSVAFKTYKGLITIDNAIHLTGKVLYPNNEGVSNVKISTSSTKNTTVAFTDTFGNYKMDVLPGQYNISPSKLNDPNTLNGIDVQDIATIRRHILGIQTLPTPYQIIAADVDQSKSVSTLDLILTQALILGVKPGFPNNMQWSFVISDYVFPKPLDPFPYSSSKIVSETGSNSFYAMKLGDVNNSRDNTQQGRTQNREVVFESVTPLSTTTGIIEIPVQVYGFEEIAAYQFTMNWNKDSLEYVGIRDLAVKGAYGEQAAMNGSLTTLWDEGSGTKLTLPDGSKLFAVQFMKKQDGHSGRFVITSTVTPAQVYDSNILNLVFKSAEKQDGEEVNNFEVTQNFPNPFKDQTTIAFRLPQPMELKIEVKDVLGKKVNEFTAFFDKGIQNFTWDGRDDKGSIVTPGIYLLAITNGQEKAVLKMLKK